MWGLIIYLGREFSGPNLGFESWMRNGQISIILFIRFLGVFGEFTRNGGFGGGRRSASGLEGGEIRRGRVVIMGNSIGGVETFLRADLVFKVFLSLFTADEVLGVGVVPSGEADFGGGAVGLVVVRGEGEDWELDERF